MDNMEGARPIPQEVAKPSGFKRENIASKMGQHLGSAKNWLKKMYDETDIPIPGTKDRYINTMGITGGLVAAAAIGTAAMGAGGELNKVDAFDAVSNAYQSAVTRPLPEGSTVQNGITIVPLGEKKTNEGTITPIESERYIDEAIDTVFKNLTLQERAEVEEKVKEMATLLSEYYTGADYIRVLQYEDLIENAAEKHGYSKDIAEGLALIESRGITEGPEATSSAGAVGMWQLMPDTARERGLTVDFESGIDERTDVFKSTDAAMGYLEKMKRDTFGNTGLEVLAYNWGWGNTIDAADDLGGIEGLSIHKMVEGTPDMPLEAREYPYKTAAAISLLAKYRADKLGGN